MLFAVRSTNCDDAAAALAASVAANVGTSASHVSSCNSFTRAWLRRIDDWPSSALAAASATGSQPTAPKRLPRAWRIVRILNEMDTDSRRLHFAGWLRNRTQPSRHCGSVSCGHQVPTAGLALLSEGELDSGVGCERGRPRELLTANERGMLSENREILDFRPGSRQTPRTWPAMAVKRGERSNQYKLNETADRGRYSAFSRHSS
jgi:hypothetical protein